MLVDPTEVAEAVGDAWNELYNCQQLDPPSGDEFLRQYGRELQQLRSEADPLPRFHGRMAALVSGLSPSAAGPDGWQAKELQALPPYLLELAGSLLDTVEVCGAWPQQLILARVAHLQKPAKSPDESIAWDVVATRPTTILPLLYRVWGSARSKDLLAWERRWLPPSVRGGHPGRGALDVARSLAAQFDVSRSAKMASAAGLLDKAKCYDRIAIQVALTVLKELGCPRQFVAAYGHSLSNLQRVHIVSGVSTVPCGQSNGVPQGDAVSVLVIKALTGVFLCQIPGCRAAGYVDDISCHVSTPDAVFDFVEQSLRFDVLTGQVCNMDKSQILTEDRFQKQVESRGLVMPFEMATSAKLLGITLCQARVGRHIGDMDLASKMTQRALRIVC